MNVKQVSKEIQELRLIRAEVGNRVRAQREALGIGTEELGQLIGIVKITFEQKETGRNGFTAAELAVIAKRLGVSSDYLLGLTPPMVSDKDASLLGLPVPHISHEDAKLLSLIADMPETVRRCARAAVRAMNEAAVAA
jgi:transcriptional regulator with XRE-family HTH domain